MHAATIHHKSVNCISEALSNKLGFATRPEGDICQIQFSTFHLEIPTLIHVEKIVKLIYFAVESAISLKHAYVKLHELLL